MCTRCKRLHLYTVFLKKKKGKKENMTLCHTIHDPLVFLHFSKYSTNAYAHNTCVFTPMNTHAHYSTPINISGRFGRPMISWAKYLGIPLWQITWAYNQSPPCWGGVEIKGSRRGCCILQLPRSSSGIIITSDDHFVFLSYVIYEWKSSGSKA